MVAHAVIADRENPGNFLVRMALGENCDNLDLALAQRGVGRAGILPFAPDLCEQLALPFVEGTSRLHLGAVLGKDRAHHILRDLTHARLARQRNKFFQNVERLTAPVVPVDNQEQRQHVAHLRMHERALFGGLPRILQQRNGSVRIARGFMAIGRRNRVGLALLPAPRLFVQCDVVVGPVPDILARKARLARQALPQPLKQSPDPAQPSRIENRLFGIEEFDRTGQPLRVHVETGHRFVRREVDIEPRLPVGQAIGLDGVILLAYVIAIPANEIVVPTMLMVYMGVGMMSDITSYDQIRTLLVDQHGWTMLTAVNLMLFSVLHNPCATTIITIWRETRSGKWTTIGALMPLAFAFLTTFSVAVMWRMLG